MNSTTNVDYDEAQEILDALRTIQDSPALRAEARINPDSVVKRLGLSTVASHAVAFALTVAVVGPGVAGHSMFGAFWS